MRERLSYYRRLGAARARWLLASGLRRVRPGTHEYERHSRTEQRHYAEVFAADGGSLVEPSPESWLEVERRLAELIRRAAGDDVSGHLLRRLKVRPKVRMLSLGSGPGGVELELARQAPEADYVCMDFNETLLALGQRHAEEAQLPVRFAKADLNTVRLPVGEFDLVFCHASLHHVLELEWLAAQIRETLRPGGELVLVDVITPNGHRMWPETRKVVDRVWSTLPERFRLNHTAYPSPRVDKRVWEIDTRILGMECIRSQDILGVLSRELTPVVLFPHLTFARRFLHTMYGPNYDLAKPLDKAIFDWIWELDCHYLSTGELRGETVFGIYRSKEA